MTTPVIIDIVVAAVLLGFAVYGGKRGLFRALSGLLAVVVALVGAVGEGADGIYDLGVCGVFTTNHRPEPFETARLHAADNLRRTIRNLMGLLKAVEG